MNLKEERKRHKEEEKQKAEHQSKSLLKHKKFLEQLAILNQSDEYQQKQEKAKRQRISQSNHEFVSNLNNAVITIPDEVIEYNLQKAGCNCPDLRVKRLVGIAAKKMILDVCNAALAHREHYIRSLPATKQKAFKNKKQTLEMNHLLMALRDKG
eukprot:792847_1